MADTATGQRGIYVADKEASLPYKVYDADNHFYPPPDALVRHLDPEVAQRYGLEEGNAQAAVAEVNTQEMDEDHVRRTIGMHPLPAGGHGGVDVTELPEMEGDIPIPGMMLNRLNPMRDLDQLSQADLVHRYNEMRPAFEHKTPRLALMDLQGVEAAVVHTGVSSGERAFRAGDIDGGYQMAHAFNQWLLDDWGFNTDDRIFTPVDVPLVDPDRAVAELQWCLDNGARFVNLPSGPAPLNRSPFDPYFDPFWSLMDESGTRVAVHLGAHYGRHGEEWGEDPDTLYPDFNGFQWVSYWSDRPIMDTVTAMVFHNLFGRFPNVKVLIAEFGAVWAPYLLRKLDHAMMLGRRPKWGDMPGRPSQLVKERCVIAPYPEENVSRAMEVLGTDCLVFGSDFPHSEGLPDPVQYASQLQGLDEEIVRKIMRDNLASFIAG